MSKIAGVSYDELVRQSFDLVEASASPEIVDYLSDQLNVLVALLDADNTDACFRVVIQSQTMARCGSLIRASWDWKGVDAGLLARSRLQIITVWKLVLGRATILTRPDIQPAREMLDSQYLFLVERWSINAPDAQLCE